MGVGLEPAQMECKRGKDVTINGLTGAYYGEWDKTTNTQSGRGIFAAADGLVRLGYFENG